MHETSLYRTTIAPGRATDSGAAILVDQPAEHVDPLHGRWYGSRSDGGHRPGWMGWLQVEGAVWPCTVVVLKVIGQDLVQLTLVPNQRPVQAVVAHGAYPPFGVGVDPHHLDADSASIVVVVHGRRVELDLGRLRASDSEEPLTTHVD